MDIAALEQAADQAAAAGRFKDAAGLLEQLTNHAGDRAEPWAKLSAMRRASGDLMGALTAIDKRPIMTHDGPPLLVQRGALRGVRTKVRCGADPFSCATIQRTSWQSTVRRLSFQCLTV